MKYIRNDPSLKERRRQLRKDQTEAEKALWKCVRGRQVQGLKFLRQYSVGPYILDFYCPALKLAVELDGGQHNEAEIREYDEARSDFLHAQGIRLLRFWNHEVLQQSEAVLLKIAEEVKDKK